MAGIVIERLVKSYGGDAKAATVSELSLEIADGAFVTLLGPSGCGKTTTLRLIAGFIRPDGGSIRVGDRVISSATCLVPPEQRGMGMVFQSYAVWPHMTVGDNVAFGLRIRAVSKAEIAAKVARALVLVDLAGLEKHYPAELSGGQQQRVALARSLVVEPQILLLDEPLSNLDAKLRERMRIELKQLQRRTGITFVYVTHDQTEALALSDRIAVMHGGRLQQYGSPEEVYARPANRVVADFMGLVNFVATRVSAIGGGRARLALAPKVWIECEVPTGTTLGSKLDVAIRPESIELASAETAAPRHALGTVLERTYLGNFTEYVVAIDNGPTLRCQSHPRDRFAIGQPVSIWIDAARCSVFGA